MAHYPIMSKKLTRTPRSGRRDSANRPQLNSRKRVSRPTKQDQLDPLWSFKSDGWRAYAFTVKPACAVVVIVALVLLAPHAATAGFAGMAGALRWLTGR